MPVESFAEFQTKIQRLYHQGEYAEAYRLANEIVARFPDQAPLVNYWRICMAARLGKHQQALELLGQLIENGFWYGETLLRKSPSLSSLQGDSLFEKLVERSLRQQQLDQQQLYPLLTLRTQGGCQDDEHPCPLLIGLHANGSNAQASIDFWKAAASAGWLVGVPQSSQAMWKDAYTWSDLEMARQEIEGHISLLQRQYAADQERLVFAGHSMGGELAIWLALNGVFEARGFVALAPIGSYMDEPESWQPFVDNAAGRKLKGYLIYGEQDPSILPENLHALARMLFEADIPCEIDLLADAGHDYHPAYTAALLRGIQYVIS